MESDRSMDDLDDVDDHRLPSTQKAIEHGTIEFVDLPMIAIKNMVIFRFAKCEFRVYRT